MVQTTLVQDTPKIHTHSTRVWNEERETRGCGLVYSEDRGFESIFNCVSFIVLVATVSPVFQAKLDRLPATPQSSGANVWLPSEDEIQKWERIALNFSRAGNTYKWGMPPGLCVVECPHRPARTSAILWIIRVPSGGGGGGQQPAHPQYANYWAPLTRKRHILPHSAQPQYTKYWAPRTRKRHQQEHRPQRLTESSNPMQHAKGRTGDRPGPRKETTTRRNVTQGGGGGGWSVAAPLHPVFDR